MRRSRQNEDLPDIVLLDETTHDWEVSVQRSAHDHADDPEVTQDRALFGGTDYLGEAVEGIKDWRATKQADWISEQAGATAAGMASTSVLPRRRAQVVQATQVLMPQLLECLASPGFFAKGQRLRLRIDPTTLQQMDGEEVMTGKLRMRLGNQRRVQLRMYPTASGNLTIMELLPKRRWMPQTRRFLRSGVPAITRLTDRVEAQLPPPQHL